MSRSLLLYGIIFGGIIAMGSSVVNAEVGQMAIGAIAGIFCMIFAPIRSLEVVLLVCLAVGIGLIAKMGLLGVGIFASFTGAWVCGYAFFNSRIS